MNYSGLKYDTEVTTKVLLELIAFPSRYKFL